MFLYHHLIVRGTRKFIRKLRRSKHDIENSYTNKNMYAGNLLYAGNLQVEKSSYRVKFVDPRRSRGQ